MVSIVIPATMGGGWMWLLDGGDGPAARRVDADARLRRADPEHVQLRGRGPLTAIVICTAVAVAVFCGVVALAFQH